MTETEATRPPLSDLDWYLAYWNHSLYATPREMAEILGVVTPEEAKEWVEDIGIESVRDRDEDRYVRLGLALREERGWRDPDIRNRLGVTARQMNRVMVAEALAGEE